MEDRNDDTDSRCLVGDTTNKYHLLSTYCASRSFPGGTVVKNPRANAGDARDVGSIFGSERSSGRGNDNPLQYCSLENSMDRGVWQATVHEVAKSWM